MGEVIVAYRWRRSTAYDVHTYERNCCSAVLINEDHISKLNFIPIPPLQKQTDCNFFSPKSLYFYFVSCLSMQFYVCI